MDFYIDKIFSKFYLLISVALLIFGGCTMGEASDEEYVKKIYVSPSEVTLKVRETVQLTCTFEPSHLDAPWVDFTSADESVAVVDDNGFILGVDYGTTVITADIGNDKKQIKVTVSGELPWVEIFDFLMIVGEKDYELQYDERTIQYEFVDRLKDIILISENPEIVKINNNGRLDAVSEGKAVVWLTANDGKVNVPCEITVVPVPALSIEASQHVSGIRDVLELGAETNLHYIVSSIYSPIRDIRYYTEDNDIISVENNGLVKGLSKGVATIHFSANGGVVTASMEIEVKGYKPTGIQFNSTEQYVYEGEQIKLDYTLTPSNADPGFITWRFQSSDVEVDNNGKVTGLRDSKSTITVFLPDGRGSASTIVRVIRKGDAVVNFKEERRYMTLGGSLPMAEFTAFPTSIYSNSFWSSTNSNLVTVDANGNLQAVGYGSVNVELRSPEFIGAIVYSVWVINIDNCIRGKFEYYYDEDKRQYVPVRITAYNDSQATINLNSIYIYAGGKIAIGSNYVNTSIFPDSEVNWEFYPKSPTFTTSPVPYEYYEIAYSLSGVQKILRVNL